MKYSESAAIFLDSAAEFSDSAAENSGLSESDEKSTAGAAWPVVLRVGSAAGSEDDDGPAAADDADEDAEEHLGVGVLAQDHARRADASAEEHAKCEPVDGVEVEDDGECECVCTAHEYAWKKERSREKRKVKMSWRD